MDIQQACIAKIVLDGDILPFVEAKITTAFFPDDKHRKVYEFVLDHYKSHGNPPSKDALHRAYPNYTLPVLPETTAYYLNQLQQDRKAVIVMAAVQDFANRANADDKGASLGDDLEAILRQGLANAAHEVSQGRDTDFFLSTDRIMERIRDRRKNPGYLRGISTGFDGIDRITRGLQPEQLVTLIGTPKAGKSSVLLRMALTAKLHSHDVLFLTFEMSTEEQEDRLLSLLSGVSLTSILTGNMSDSDERKIETALVLRKALSGFTITSDINSATTLSGVQAKFQQYRPHIVFVDGLYLMDDEDGHIKGSPQHLTSLTRGFKRMAQSHRVPIVATTQALLSRSRNGLTMDSVGYSSSFAQDSDVLLGVAADANVKNVSKLSVLGIRSGPTGAVYVGTEWTKGDISEMDQSRYEKLATLAQHGAAGSQSAMSAVFSDDDDD